MKKIMLLLLCSVMVMTSTAQNYVIHRHRADYTPPKEHLSFDGIAINGLGKNVLNSLKKKGYEILTKGNEGAEYYEYATGKYAGIDGWEVYVHADSETDSVHSITLFREYASALKRATRYGDIKSYIESHYPIKGTVKLRSEESLGSDNEIIYSVGELGTITVTYGIEESEFFVGIKFEDKINHKRYGYHPVVERYELKNTSTAFQNCIIEISDEEIKYNVNCNNKTFTLISRGDDRDQIHQLLVANYKEQQKIYVLNDYILTGLERYKEFDAIPIMETEYEYICKKIVAAVQKAQQAPSQTMQPKQVFLEYLRQVIYSPQERKLLDKVISPEVQRQMIGGTLNVMSSSDGYRTSYEKYINPYVHD